MNWIILAAVIASLNQFSGLVKNLLDMYFKVKEEMQKSRSHQEDDSN